MEQITKRQEAILAFIRQSLRQRGYPPSLREIGKQFGIASTNGVRYHLGALEKAGLLKRREYTSRGIHLAEEAPRPSASQPVPLVGRVAAGPLTEALEEVEREIDLDRPLFGLGEGEQLFCLRVQGDSMTGAGILDGDVVIVRPKSDPRPGQIVVARLDGEATVKRLERQGSSIRLLPENPAYEPIEINPGQDEEFQILGVVAGLIRQDMP
jgi:repressor LexA